MVLSQSSPQQQLYSALLWVSAGSGSRQPCTEMVSEVTSRIVAGFTVHQWLPSFICSAVWASSVGASPCCWRRRHGGLWETEAFKVQGNKGESSSQYPSQTSSPLFFFFLVLLLPSFWGRFFLWQVFHIGFGNLVAWFLIWIGTILLWIAPSWSVGKCLCSSVR